MAIMSIMSSCKQTIIVMNPSLNALIRLLCVIFFVKLPSKNEVRRDRRGRGGSQQRHEPENKKNKIGREMK